MWTGKHLQNFLIKSLFCLVFLILAFPRKRIYGKKTFERGNFYICLYLIGPFSVATKPVNMATKPIVIATACALYFLKIVQNSFLFQLKSSFCSPSIQFLVFFSFSAVSSFKGSDETWIIMMSGIGLHKLANIIFGIAQKPHCIKSSKLIKVIDH